MTEEEFLKQENEIMLEEKHEILKHKWCMSEKFKEDVGLEQALLDWKCNHWQKWLSWFKQQLEVRRRTEDAARGAF